MREVEMFAQLLAQEQHSAREKDNPRADGRIEADGIGAALMAFAAQHNARLVAQQGKQA